MTDVLLQSPATGDAPAATPRLSITHSPRFPEWLAGQSASLCFTTYQAGKIFLVGSRETGRLSIFERTLDRCMGLTSVGRSIYVSTLWQLWRFENALAPDDGSDGYDGIFVPQLGYVTGDLDIHDLAVDADGRVVFVNTLFSCLATTSDSHSFRPLWQPPFVSGLAAEDRCHLNGLALRDGEPAYATAVGECDTADGWRERRRDGGCVIDIARNEVIARGLSMPHSPRWRGNRLWLHNSGTGEFGFVDPTTGVFEAVCFGPGYLRGLAFIGEYAVMGLSLPRDNKAFTGLALEDTLAKRQASAQCGLQVVDLARGEIVHWLRLEGVVTELYDVVALPGVRRPMMIGFRSDEIRRVISVDA